MRNGDFSASTTPIFDPLTGNQATGADRTQFANNQIPTSRISPIAQRILANVPLPNIDAPIGQPNYQDTTTRERRTDGFDVKVNYQVSSKDQTSIRYSYQRPTVFDAVELRAAISAVRIRTASSASARTRPTRWPATGRAPGATRS